MLQHPIEAAWHVRVSHERRRVGPVRGVGPRRRVGAEEVRDDGVGDESFKDSLAPFNFDMIPLDSLLRSA